MFKMIISILIIVFVNSAFSKTINVPADKTTIQAGINAAMDGDTVLVQPGTYVENINFRGKNIVVGSLFLTTRDTSFISQTVIDGNSSGSVIIFENGEDFTAVLTGFKLQNGLNDRGGGIHCLSSSPTLNHLIIRDNCSVGIFGGGAGIYCGHDANPQIHDVKILSNETSNHGGGIMCDMFSSPQIYNSTISGNIANAGAGLWCSQSNLELKTVVISRNMAGFRADYDSGFLGKPGGSGIYCLHSNPTLINVQIRENQSRYDGGGIILEKSNPFLSNVSIIGNTACSEGGGIWTWVSQPVFDTNNRCQIYQNFAPRGRDLYDSWHDLWSQIVEVIVDTFSVKDPNDSFVFPIENFNLDILHGKTEVINSDLYVNPNGDDTNSGLSPEEPLKTVRQAILKVWADSLHPVTIYCANGHYSPSTNGEFFPIYLPNYISLIGQTEQGVVLDAEKQNSVLFITQNRTSTIEKLTVTGGTKGIECFYSSSPYITNVTVRNNEGSGIVCAFSDPTITDVKVFENQGNPEGGGVQSLDSSPKLKNVILRDNSATRGGGIYITGGPLFLSNVTICKNKAIYGGGIYSVFGSLSFDDINRCNIYLNHAVAAGYDLYDHNSEHIFVKVDTFTVKIPTKYIVSPLNNITLDKLNYKIEQVSADLYVSPDGNNSNSGLSPEQPLSTVFFASLKILPDEQEHHTIFLKNGRYKSSNSMEFFPLRLPDHVTLSGESESGVILDAESVNRVMAFDGNKDILLENLTITGGSANLEKESYNGGGIYCNESQLTMRNISLRKNTAREGGGIYCNESQLSMRNMSIKMNNAQQGGGLCLAGSNIKLEDVTISQNYATYGGGINFIKSEVIFDSENRCNIYSNNSSNLGKDLFARFNHPLIAVLVDTFTVMTPTEKHARPLSRFTFDILHEKELITSASEINSKPLSYKLYNNFPNPFNPSTVIEYDLPRSVHVQLVIYDILGREVKRLLDEQKPAGQHRIIWDATNENDEQVAAGLYFCHIKAGGYSKIHKMLLVK